MFYIVKVGSFNVESFFSYFEPNTYIALPKDIIVSLGINKLGTDTGASRKCNWETFQNMIRTWNSNKYQIDNDIICLQYSRSYCYVRNV